MIFAIPVILGMSINGYFIIEFWLYNHDIIIPGCFLHIWKEFSL